MIHLLLHFFRGWHHSLFKARNYAANFKSIAEFAANGSEVVLDYSTDFQELNGIERLGSMGVAQFTHLLKEPLLGQFKPRDLHHAVDRWDLKWSKTYQVKPLLNDILMHGPMKFATPQQHGYCICV
jgi:hypothetical protein